MSLEFDYYSLGDLVKIKYGKNQKKVQDDENGQYPIFGTGGLMGYSIEYLYDKPSVLIGRKGSIEKVRYIEEPFWTVDTLFYTEVNEKIVIPKFLYYVMSLIDLSRYNEGTSIPSLRTETLNRLDLPIPDLGYQNKVLSVLSKIDEKIEINEKINKNLEEMAQSFLNENFFIFSQYSENQLTDTDIGKIPINWRIYKLQELFNHIKPGTNYQPKRVEEGIPFLNVKNINSGFIDLSDVKCISIEDFKKVHKTWVPEENDILISRIGTLGLITVIDKEDLPIAVHYNFITVKSNILPHQFVYFLFKSNNFQRKYHTIKKYSVQEYVTIDDFSEIEIALPNNLDEVISQFNLFINIFDMIQENISEIKKLQILRDTLLPKLMSGEIDVSKINCDLNNE